jgi:hypothetical protein
MTVKLLPSLLNATASELAAFLARLRDGYCGPPIHEATPADLAAYRAYLRDLQDDPPGRPGFKRATREVMPDKIKYGGYQVPPGTPPDKADQAFDEIADKIIAYLSSPIPSQPDPPCYVGPCEACGKTDCFATASPWVAPLVYIDGTAYVTGGLCCFKDWGKKEPMNHCAHPMIEK